MSACIVYVIVVLTHLMSWKPRPLLTSSRKATSRGPSLGSGKSSLVTSCMSQQCFRWSAKRTWCYRAAALGFFQDEGQSVPRLYVPTLMS